jgi:hypothetical protein
MPDPIDLDREAARQLGKVVNFGQGFGLGAPDLSRGFLDVREHWVASSVALDRACRDLQSFLLSGANRPHWKPKARPEPRTIWDHLMGDDWWR